MTHIKGILSAWGETTYIIKRGPKHTINMFLGFSELFFPFKISFFFKFLVIVVSKKVLLGPKPVSEKWLPGPKPVSENMLLGP